MVINKFKAVIQPLQMWLLDNKRCVGCGKELLKSAQVKKKSAQEDFYTCSCGRIYVFNKNKKGFRRALVKELS
jgi:transcription elongation factor Elf1